MRKPTFLFLAVVSLSVPSIGCFDIEEQITVELVSIDTSQAQLAATAIFRDAPIEDGTMVTFRTDHGSFDSEREQTTIDVAASGGRATTTLLVDGRGTLSGSSDPCLQSGGRHAI